jgi:transposase
MSSIDKNRVSLTSKQRIQLRSLIHDCALNTRSSLHAEILLLSDTSCSGPGLTDEVIASQFGVHSNTVARVRKRFLTEGLDPAIQRRRPTGREFTKLDSTQQNLLVELVCGPVPDGHHRWTHRLLAAELVARGVVESIDPSTVQRTLNMPANKTALDVAREARVKSSSPRPELLEAILAVSRLLHDLNRSGSRTAEQIRANPRIAGKPRRSRSDSGNPVSILDQ